MFKECKIASLRISPALVLAPMSGVTSAPFRRLIRRLNPGAVGMVVSEFLSVEGMTRNSRRTFDMLRFFEDERPVGIQIFGFDIDRMRDAALMVQDSGADLLDINCGCPAPKVVKRGGGCVLMKNPEHLSQMLREVRKAIKIPLTVKMRAGWDDSSRNAAEIAAICEAEGVDAITIHGRTRQEGYSGSANWDVVEEIASQLKIPVLGSGDVVSADAARERLRPGIAGLYIGRAALSNPYVFSEVLGAAPRDVRHSEALQVEILRLFSELLQEGFPAAAWVGRMKQLAAKLCRGKGFLVPLLRAKTLDEQIAILGSYDASNTISKVENC